MDDNKDAYELGEMVSMGRRVAYHACGDDPDRILANLLIQLTEVYELRHRDAERCALVSAIMAGSLVQLIEALQLARPGLVSAARKRMDDLLEDIHQRRGPDVDLPS